MKNEFEDSLSAEVNGSLHEWVIDYLNDHERGNNTSLANTLSKHGSTYMKLIDCPLDMFEAILGPSHSYLYYEEPEVYNRRVENMVSSLIDGWKPTPLIASNIWSDAFEISDGAHRAEALKRVGKITYPTIIYFKDKTSYDEFHSRIGI